MDVLALLDAQYTATTGKPAQTKRWVSRTTRGGGVTVLYWTGAGPSHTGTGTSNTERLSRQIASQLAEKNLGDSTYLFASRSAD